MPIQSKVVSPDHVLPERGLYSYDPEADWMYRSPPPRPLLGNDLDDSRFSDFDSMHRNPPQSQHQSRSATDVSHHLGYSDAHLLSGSRTHSDAHTLPDLHPGSRARSDSRSLSDSHSDPRYRARSHSWISVSSGDHNPIPPDAEITLLREENAQLKIDCARLEGKLISMSYALNCFYSTGATDLALGIITCF